MDIGMKKLLLAAFLLLGLPTFASAQCDGVLASGAFCGNSGASPDLAGEATPNAMFDRAICATNNSAHVRIAGSWVCLASANNGVWVTSAAGVPSISSTLPNAVQDNITRLGTIANITTPLGLAFGGTAANLTASNGGIVYSGPSALAILAGTATAGQIPRSGSSAAPSWSTATYPATAAAGTILAAGSLNVIAGTATPTLGANGGTGGQITLNGATSGSAVLSVAAAAGTSNFRFPVGNGSSTNVLQTDGSGNTSWTAAGAGTVTSVICGTGLDGGTITATGTCSLSAARRTLPTLQIFTSGTDLTYTTPANTLYIDVLLVPGGGGGGGSGTGGGTGGNGGPSCWKASGTACTSPLSSATAGTGGGGSGATPGAGGTTTGTCNMGSWDGANGQGADLTVGGQISGGSGGGTHAGGGGGGGTPGGAGAPGAAHTGGGGGGGAANSVGAAGSGAGGGGVCKFRINSPAASYVYTCGAAGTAGTAGTSGQTGGTGGSCYIVVDEHYGS